MGAVGRKRERGREVESESKMWGDGGRENRGEREKGGEGERDR